MQRLTFINAKGASITFNDQAPYVFWKISGLEFPTVEPIFTQSSGQNGYTLHNILLDGRKVRLACHVHGVNGVAQMYEKRRELNKICNPIFGIGKLIYQNDFGTWSINAFGSANPYADKLREIQTLNVEFSSPSAFWKTEDLKQTNLAFIEGGLEFPLDTPTSFGLSSYYAEVDNDGDSDAPMEIYIDGGAINPTITNMTTGEFIKIEKYINTYEKIFINTDSENIEVSLITINSTTNEPERINAFGYLSDDSKLFQFVPGVNRLTFSSDDNNQLVKIRFLYNLYYMGV